MKKFIFSLQFLLDYRKRKEDVVKRKLAEIQKRWEKEKEILEKMKIERTNYEEELRRRELSMEIEIPEILLYQSHLDRITYQIKRQTREVDKLFLEMEKERKQLREASKKRKVVEELRKRSWQGWALNMEKLEQQDIDEIAIAKFNFRKDNRGLK